MTSIVRTQTSEVSEGSGRVKRIYNILQCAGGKYRVHCGMYSSEFSEGPAFLTGPISISRNYVKK